MRLHHTVAAVLPPAGARARSARAHAAGLFLKLQKLRPALPWPCLQLYCGSCWAFVATAAIESKYIISKSKRLDLSEQQFNDCVNSATDPEYYSTVRPGHPSKAAGSRQGYEPTSKPQTGCVMGWQAS